MNKFTDIIETIGAITLLILIVAAYAPDNHYFDHSNGIAGFKTVQYRTNYIGHMTEKELDEWLSIRQLNSNTANSGRQYVNVSRMYDARH